MNDTEAHEFELGTATGRQFAPSPYWLAGYIWGTWLGMIGKAMEEWR